MSHINFYITLKSHIWVINLKDFLMNDKEKLYCKFVGEAIRKLRVEHTRKSTVLFAYENDIPKSTLTRIERGENEAQLVTLKKIAEAFGWTMSELFYNIEKNCPEGFKIFDEEHY